MAAIEHAYDGDTVVFPDGRIITQSGWDEDAKRTPEEQAAFHLARHRVGAQDDSFVLSQLEKLDSGVLAGAPRQFRGRLDTTRVGALGHSLGGKIAITACSHDKRFKVCMNLDGKLDAGVSYRSMSQPVAAMYGDRRPQKRPDETAEAFSRRKDDAEAFRRSLKSDYDAPAAGSFFVLVDSAGFSHFSYYDLPNSQAEAPPWNATQEQWIRNKQIIRAFIVATFESYLRSKSPASLASFNSLLKQYPEVKIEAIGN